MKIKPFFRWYDLWIGIYVDTKARAIYVIPVPMLGIKIQLKGAGDHEGANGNSI